MRLRDHIADLVHRASDEVHELKFSNRAHSCKRCAECRSNNCRFGNRGINHALRTKAINQAVGDLESAAVDTNVLAQAENGWVALHLLPNSLPDGFQISKLRHDGKEFTTIWRRALSLGCNLGGVRN